MEPDFVLAGRLSRDYRLPPTGHPQLDVPGGSLLYAASGASVWDHRIGLLARVGEDYPRPWLQTYKKVGWDVRGIHVLPQALDLRYFQARTDAQTFFNNNPLANFARRDLPFPKALMGYQVPAQSTDRKKILPTSPRPADIPTDYLDARAVHLCPLDYLSAHRLISAFRHGNITTLTLDPSADMMIPAALGDLRSLMGDLTAFMPSAEEMSALFWGSTNDLWQMAEAIADFGVELVVVKRGVSGQLLYDSVAKKRWVVPAYPARLEDLSGAGDSFCGGFLVGYQKTFDPLRAVLYGCVSASLTVEGSGVFHALDALPGLAEARLNSLVPLVRQA